MKAFYISLALVFAFFGTTPCFSSQGGNDEPNHGQLESIPLAQVNNNTIYLSELMPRMRKIASATYSQKEISPLVAEEIKKSAINQLVTEELARQKAEKLGVTVTEDEITRDISFLRKSMGDEKHFQNYLLRENLDEGRLRREIRNFLAVKKVIEQEVNGKIQINPSDLEELYHKKIDEFTRKEKMVVAAVVFFLDPKSPEARSEVAMVKAKLGESENDFSQLPQTERYLVQDYTIESPQHPLYSPAKNLQKGSVSDPIVIDGTTHILKLKEYQPEYIPPKATVITLLERSLREEKRKEEIEKWRTSLWQEADIEIFATTVE